MNKKSYAVSLIVDDKKEIKGVHVIDLVFLENCYSASDVQYTFRDIYDLDKNKAEGVENLGVVDGKITTIHGSKKSYNTLGINAFGHVIPIKDNSLTVLFKLGNNYACINATDRFAVLNYEQMLRMENNGIDFSNISLDKVRNTVRPIAHKGYSNNIFDLNSKVNKFIDEDISEALEKWLFAPKARVLLLDIDGTLTDKNGAVPPQMIDTLKKVNALPNTYAILSTGRILEHELSKSINSEIVALGNGTLIFYKGKLVSSLTLDTNEALKVAAFAEKKGYACQAYEPEKRLIIQRKNSYQHDDPEAKNPNNSIMIVDKHTYDDVDKTPKMLIAVSPDKTKQVQEEVKQIVDLSKCNVMITTKTTVEIVPKGVDKELSLRQICKFLGISPSEIIAVGDNDNDLPMLRAAGLSYAVSNGSENVKRAVSRVLWKPMWEGSNELLSILLLSYYKRIEKKAI